MDTQLDPAHCGAWDNAAGPAGEVCSAGMCALTCGGGSTLCTDKCVTTASDPAHCGMCNNACATATNAVSVCVAGACKFVCNATFADCNVVAADGCEIDLSADVNNCGLCGNMCPAMQTCTAGACS